MHEGLHEGLHDRRTKPYVLFQTHVSLYVFQAQIYSGSSNRPVPPHLQHAISPTVSTRVISVSEIAMDHMHLQTSQQQVGYSRQKPIYLDDCWYGNYKQIYRRKPLTALPIEQCWFHIGMLHLLLKTSSLRVHLKVGVNCLTLSPVSHPSSRYGCT